MPPCLKTSLVVYKTGKEPATARVALQAERTQVHAMDQLEGRGAVVIGGGSGIGRGIALALAAEGMRVLVADIDGDSAGAVRAEITGRGGDAHAAQVDATDREALAELAAATRDELHRVHVLVNTVGVLTDASVTT